MVHTAIFTELSTGCRTHYRKRNSVMDKIYQVCVYGEDGDFEEFEVSAYDEAEAQSKVESLTNIVDIQFIDIMSL